MTSQFLEQVTHQNRPIKLPDTNMNMVIVPISFEEGMAGSYRLKNLVKILRNSGVNCKNIVLRSNGTLGKNKELALFPEYLDNSRFGFLFRLFFVFKYLIRFKDKGKNFLYNYGYPNIQNSFYIFFAKLIGYKILFDIVEDNFTITTYKSWWAKLRVKSSLFFIHNIGLIANAITVINDHLFKMIVDQGIGKTPVIKIPISIDKEEFKSQLHHNGFDIFHGGSLGEKDGLDFLLKAFDRIADKYPKARLIITGKASKYDQISFEKYLSRLRNYHKVIIKGYLPREKYLALLHESSVHCIARVDSDYAKGGFPFKLGEMLASGVPVIGTKVGEVERYLTHHVNAFLIPAGSEDAIYYAIEYVFENREHAKKIAEKGQKLAFTTFDISTVREEMISLLKTI